MLTLIANNHYAPAACLLQTADGWLHVCQLYRSHFSLPRMHFLQPHSIRPHALYRLNSSLLTTVRFSIPLPSCPVSHNHSISLSLSLLPLIHLSLCALRLCITLPPPPPPAGVSCLLWHVSRSPDVCVGCCWKLGHVERERERGREARRRDESEGK